MKKAGKNKETHRVGNGNKPFKIEYSGFDGVKMVEGNFNHHNKKDRSIRRHIENSFGLKNISYEWSVEEENMKEAIEAVTTLEFATFNKMTSIPVHELGIEIHEGLSETVLITPSKLINRSPFTAFFDHDAGEWKHDYFFETVNWDGDMSLYMWSYIETWD